MNYVLHSIGKIVGIYKGDSPPDLKVESIVISDADVEMCKNNQEDFLIIGDSLVLNNNHLKNIRVKRNYLLADSDRYLAPDFPTGELTREQWTAKVLIYRQELRDLPATCDITNPVFPIL